ncbi:MULTISPECIES: hypothetical protein [unclassified Streptomyces]|uniref:hypothetical protein n=1 Tax=unclassified Streptomyces TaxID=2593676 RepID=UPI00081B1F32|nr:MULTISPECIES: hypothetical protein [unclassified Streptomyces]SCD50867.1 hypothetical protein GA0115234_101911 [Streptomyces sp. DvalAA-43]
MEHVQERTLTTGQGVILGAAAVPMLVVGGIGAVGTYTNIKSQFSESATALGVVAAGEGATLVLALVMVGVTLLGQSSPRAVRIGLWVFPMGASVTGAVVASGLKESVVYAITPMAMCAAAEGLGFLARRIVVYRTRVDMEAQRRNAKTMQKIAVSRALAANHPWKWARKSAELRSWRLARRVGVGDDGLGAGLVTVQRDRMTQGADTALAAMFAPAVTPALAASVTPALELGAPVAPFGTPSVTDESDRHATGTARPGPVTDTVTQVSVETDSDPSRAAETGTGPDRDTVTATVTDRVTETGTDQTDTGSKRAVTLEDVAAVAGVPTPVTGERLTDAQLAVVLRHLRYREDPPLSYRQATAAFRSAGYVGSEERIRRIWGELMSGEETDTPATEPDSDQASDHESADEEDEEETSPRP